MRKSINVKKGNRRFLDIIIITAPYLIRHCLINNGSCSSENILSKNQGRKNRKETVINIRNMGKNMIGRKKNCNMNK